MKYCFAFLFFLIVRVTHNFYRMLRNTEKNRKIPLPGDKCSFSVYFYLNEL